LLIGLEEGNNMQKDLIRAIRRRVGQALPTGVPLMQVPGMVGGALGSMARSAGYKPEEEVLTKKQKFRLLQKGLAGKQKPSSGMKPRGKRTDLPSRMERPSPSEESTPEPVPAKIVPSFQDFMKEKAMPRTGSPNMGTLKEMIKGASPLKKE
jgi:hypothetical protein